MLLEHDLCIRDESMFGKPISELTLSFVNASISVREIISERVRTEVRRINSGELDSEGVEMLLLKYGITVDEQTAIETALSAFECNQFLVLLERQQASDLDQLVDLEKTDTVSFVKLIPMVGG